MLGAILWPFRSNGYRESLADVSIFPEGTGTRVRLPPSNLGLHASWRFQWVPAQFSRMYPRAWGRIRVRKAMWTEEELVELRRSLSLYLLSCRQHNRIWFQPAWWEHVVVDAAQEKHGEGQQARRLASQTLGWSLRRFDSWAARYEWYVNR